MIKLNSKTLKDDDDDDDDIPLVERILLKTSDPKVATVLALDLLLVGIDTVSRILCTLRENNFSSRNNNNNNNENFADIRCGNDNYLPFGKKSRKTRKIIPRT